MLEARGASMAPNTARCINCWGYCSPSLSDMIKSESFGIKTHQNMTNRNRVGDSCHVLYLIINYHMKTIPFPLSHLGYILLKLCHYKCSFQALMFYIKVTGISSLCICQVYLKLSPKHLKIDTFMESSPSLCYEPHLAICHWTIRIRGHTFQVQLY